MAQRGIALDQVLTTSTVSSVESSSTCISSFSGGYFNLQMQSISRSAT